MMDYWSGLMSQLRVFDRFLKYMMKNIYLHNFLLAFHTNIYGEGVFENFCKYSSVMANCQSSQVHCDVKFLPYNTICTWLELN